MKKISAITFLIFAFAALAFGQDRTAAATWKVLKYDIDVTLPQDNSRTVPVKAVVTLKNVSGRPATSLTLRISSFAELVAAKINESTTDFNKSEEKINSALSLQRLSARIASVPADSVLTVSVDYKLSLKENSATASISPASSQFLPLSYWYPTPNSWYFARGADAAPVRLRVATPTGHTAVSSGTESSAGVEQKLFGQPFFVVGNWDVSNQNGVSVMMPKGTGADGQKRAADLGSLFSDARTFVAAMLGKAPDVPLRIVSVRRGAGFGSGGTVLVDEAVFRRPKLDSLTAMNLAEAAARLWLGNGVEVGGEGYGIISEGLVRYIATQFIESKYGKEIADIERLRQRTAYSAVSKRDAPMATVSPIDDYYYPVVANKGAMAWRILAKRAGAAEFANAIRSGSQDGTLTSAELRTAFSAQKELVDLLFDQVTEMNLLVGLPQQENGEARVALRNTGATDILADVVATTASGQKLAAPVTVKTGIIGETVFRTAEKIVRVEIDPEKYFPQTDYFDDAQPRELTESDQLLAVKRLYDKQEYAKAESLGRSLLRDLPRFDDLRVLFARSLLAENKNSDAEREFKIVLDEKLPTSRSLAWANVGLAEVAAKANQNETALKFAEAAIATDAEYGASFAARNLRNRLGGSTAIDASVKAFFAEFDKAATANRKADIEALAQPGEEVRFVGGVAGSTQQWQTQVRHIDRLDSNTVLVEANMTIQLLNKGVETGMAVFRLTRSGTAWKLSKVEVFEVR